MTAGQLFKRLFELPRALRVGFAALSAMLIAPLAQAATFPYFGPLPSQERYIYDGFVHQWNIFKMISDPEGALFYLCLTGALVGFALILVKAENRKPAVFAGWLALVLILLVAPVGSKLLFYPLENKYSTAQSEMEENVKGFTPQVVAMHIISVVHESLVTYFTGAGYLDVVQQAIAAQGFRGAPFARLSEGNYAELKKFKKQECVGTPLLPQVMQETGTTDQKGKTRTFGEVMGNIAHYYRQGDRSSPPPVAILPEDPSAFLDSDADKAKYILGLQALYKSLYSGNLPSTSNSPSELVKGIFAHPSFKGEVSSGTACAAGSSVCGPGQISFFVAPGTVSGNVVTVNSSHLAVKARQPGEDGAKGSYDANAADYPPSANTYFNLAGLITAPDMNLPELASMPVMNGQYSPVTKSIQASPKCEEKADQLSGVLLGDMLKQANTWLQSIVSSLGGSDKFNVEKFSKLILTGEGWPEDNVLKYEHVSSECNEESLDNAGCDGVKTILTYFNNYLSKGRTPEESRKALFQSMLASAELNMDAQERKKALDQKAVDATTVGPLAGSFLGDAMTSGGGWLSEAAVGIAAKVVGFLARIFVQFIMKLADIAILAVIIVTPLMMIMGLVIPSYALGVITLTTLCVLVLKFVPLTFFLVNMISGLLYSVLGNVGSHSFLDALLGTTSQNLLVLAAAFMYMSIVGITLFIIFKIGDPSSVARLTALDSAAKSLAAVGLSLATMAGFSTVGAMKGAKKLRQQRAKDQMKEHYPDLKEGTTAYKEKFNEYMDSSRGDMSVYGAAAQAGLYEFGEGAFQAMGSFMPGGGAGLAKGLNMLDQAPARAIGIDKSGNMLSYIGDRSAAASDRYLAQEIGEYGAAQHYRGVNAEDEYYRAGWMADQQLANATQFRAQREREAAERKAFMDDQIALGNMTADGEWTAQGQQLFDDAKAEGQARRDIMQNGVTQAQELLEKGLMDSDGTLKMSRDVLLGFDSITPEGLDAAQDAMSNGYLDAKGQLTDGGKAAVFGMTEDEAKYSNAEGYARMMREGRVDENGKLTAAGLAATMGGGERLAAAVDYEKATLSRGNTSDDSFAGRQQVRRGIAESDGYMEAMQAEFGEDGPRLEHYQQSLKGGLAAQARTLNTQAQIMQTGQVTASDFQLHAEDATAVQMAKVRGTAEGIRATAGRMTFGDEVAKQRVATIQNAAATKAAAQTTASVDTYFQAASISARRQRAQLLASAASNRLVSDAELNVTADDSMRAEISKIKGRAEALRVQGRPTLAEYTTAATHQERQQIAGVKALANKVSNTRITAQSMDLLAAENANKSVDEMAGQIQGIRERMAAGRKVNYKAAARSSYLQNVANIDRMAAAMSHVKANEFYEAADLSARETAAQVKERARINPKISRTQVRQMARSKADQQLKAYEEMENEIRASNVFLMAQSEIDRLDDAGKRKMVKSSKKARELYNKLENYYSKEIYGEKVDEFIHNIEQDSGKYAKLQEDARNEVLSGPEGYKSLRSKAAKKAYKKTLQAKVTAQAKAEYEEKIPKYVMDSTLNDLAVADAERVYDGVDGGTPENFKGMKRRWKSEAELDDLRTERRTMGTEKDGYEKAAADFFRFTFKNKYEKGRNGQGGITMADHYQHGVVAHRAPGTSDIVRKANAHRRMSDINWNDYHDQISYSYESEARSRGVEGRMSKASDFVISGHSQAVSNVGRREALVKHTVTVRNAGHTEKDLREYSRIKASEVLDDTLSQLDAMKQVIDTKTGKTQLDLEIEARKAAREGNLIPLLSKYNGHKAQLVAAHTGTDVDGNDFKHDSTLDHWEGELRKAFIAKGYSGDVARRKAKNALTHLTYNANKQGERGISHTQFDDMKTAMRSFVKKLDLKYLTGKGATDESKEAAKALEDYISDKAADAKKKAEKTGKKIRANFVKKGTVLLSASGSDYVSKNNKKVKTAPADKDIVYQDKNSWQDHAEQLVTDRDRYKINVPPDAEDDGPDNGSDDGGDDGHAARRRRGDG